MDACASGFGHGGDWSWGGMTLAFLYEQISLTSDSAVKAIGGYMTLLVVIFSYFFSRS